MKGKKGNSQLKDLIFASILSSNASFMAWTALGAFVERALVGEKGKR